MVKTGPARNAGLRGWFTGLLVLSVMCTTVLLSVATTAPASAATTGLAAGIAPGNLTGLSNARLATTMQGIAASGARWVRLDAYWDQIEQSSGKFDWQDSDGPVQAAVAAGLSVDVIINGANATPSWVTTPSGNVSLFALQYAGFAQAVVQHYSGSAYKIQTYEIWNEPNLGGNWDGTASGSQYATLLRTAYSVIKDADPDSFVITGGLSPSAQGSGDVTPQAFLSAIYAAGAEGSFDAVGVHPYSFPDLPTQSASWNFFYNLPTWIHNEMVANGDGAKQVWITEYGAPTGTDSSDGAVSIATQTASVTDAFNQARQWPWVAALFWYNWQDGTNAGSIYDNFGLINASGSPKPALSAFEAEAGTPLPSTQVVTVTNELHVTTRTLPAATMHVMYLAVLSASGGTSSYKWGRQSGRLPKGLRLTSAGAIWGVPKKAGTSVFTIKVINKRTSTSPRAIATQVLWITTN